MHPVVEAAMMASRIKWNVVDGVARPYSYGQAASDAHGVVVATLGALAIEFGKRAHEAEEMADGMWRQAHDAVCLVIEEVNRP